MSECKPGDLIYGPTALDVMHGLMYASDRVAKERCSDPDILKVYPGIKWRTDESHRIYPCPDGLTGCEGGSCVVSTPEQCQTLSQLPFDSTTGGKLPIYTCKKDDDCKNLPFSPAVCGTDKTCIPKFPYMEWRADEKDPVGGQCIFGNSPLYNWCEYPHQRRTSSEAGVTNVPKFDYDPETGKCKITKPYCDWMEVSYKIDDKGRPTCYESEGQKIAEQWFVGKTIFRGIKKKVQEGFQQLPSTITKLVDKKYIKSSKLIGKDFGGSGVSLYLIEWKNSAYKLDPSADIGTTGFLGTEILKVYPELIKRINGVDFLVITQDQAKTNNYYKRIYFVSGSGKWLMSSLAKMVKK